MLTIPTTLNCRGRILDLSEPKVMGVLNITEDSFYDGGKNLSKDLIQASTRKMVEEGADIIDIGAMSSRPGSHEIDESIERERVVNALKWIKEINQSVFLSIDTYRGSVMQAAINEGAHILNDISAFKFDPDLLEVISGQQIPYVLMHMQDTPANMQVNPSYNNVLKDIIEFVVEKLKVLYTYDIPDIIVDPGFGFGKTLDQNYLLLNNLNAFKILEKPILAGISRKSMIYKFLNITPKESLSATSALHLVALQNGANLLRAHDVKEAKEIVSLWKKLKQSDYEE